MIAAGPERRHSPARVATLLPVLLAAIAWPAITRSTAQDPHEGDASRNVVTVETHPATTSMAPAAGDVEPLGQAAAERRRRARLLSRAPLARERVANPDGTVTFVLRNLLHAPVTVVVEPGGVRGALVEMLAPRLVTLQALSRLDVARVRGVSPVARGEADFVYSAVVGDPAARADTGVVYAWPFPAGARAQLSQGPGGPTHRDPFSRDAIDLAVAEGTPVLAARAGTVVFLESRYFESGMDRDKYRSRANQVRILHDDGTMASYAHLYPESIDLEPGQRVALGEQIGLSGNTGYSSGPNLHFAVLVHRDMAIVSAPFRMAGVATPAR